MTAITNALRAGGIAVDRLTGDDRVPHYSTLADPRSVELVGEALAAALQPAGVTRVLYWDTGDAVLAHIAARTLGVPAAHAFDAQGIVALAGVIAPGDVVGVVATAIRNVHHVRAMQAIAENHGASVAAVAVVVNTPAAADTAGTRVSALVEQQ